MGGDPQALKQRFNITNLGESKFMLGMRITRDRRARTIKLDQELYITKALEKFGLDQCKTAPTPGVQTSSSAQSPVEDRRHQQPADRPEAVPGEGRNAAVRSDLHETRHRVRSQQADAEHASADARTCQGVRSSVPLSSRHEVDRAYCSGAAATQRKPLSVRTQTQTGAAITLTASRSPAGLPW